MSGHRGWTAQDDEDLLHLADSGFDLESIAWTMGRSPGTVRARLNQIRRDAACAESGPVEFDPAELEAARSIEAD